MKGDQGQTEAQITAQASNIVGLDASIEFKHILMETNQKDDRIDLVQQVRACGKIVCDKKMMKVDVYDNTLGGHSGVYTSKHLIYATRIVK